MTFIDIEIDYYLGDASNGALAREVRERIAQGKMMAADFMPEDTAVEYWCRAGLAADIREAFYRRDPSRMEMLLAVLERVEAKPR